MAGDVSVTFFIVAVPKKNLIILRPFPHRSVLKKLKKHNMENRYLYFFKTHKILFLSYLH